MKSDTPESWLRRNLKWILGFGVGATVVGGAIVLISINRSDARWLALNKANSSHLLIERLGQPIEASWFVRGTIGIGSASGKADLAIPVSGPRGRGTLYVLAEKIAGTWQLTRLE